MEDKEEFLFLHRKNPFSMLVFYYSMLFFAKE